MYRVVDYRRFFRKRFISEDGFNEFNGIKYKKVLLPSPNAFYYLSKDKQIFYDSVSEVVVPLSIIMDSFGFSDIRHFLDYIQSKIVVDCIYVAYVDYKKIPRSYLPEFLIKEKDFLNFLRKIGK